MTVGLLALLAGCRPSGEGEFAGPGSTKRSELRTPQQFVARGQNFKWLFLAAGPDGELMTNDDVPVGNELKVRPETQVELLLTSDDYVYTLTAPDGTKEIAVPDMVHEITFRSPKTGAYEFKTDPMCGLRYFHDDLQGTMTIDAQPLRVRSK